MAQVRLADDVVAKLQPLADEAGHSLAAEANRQLRRALGLGTSSQVVTARVPSKARAARSRCRHPLYRRVGAFCAACGEKITR